MYMYMCTDIFVCMYICVHTFICVCIYIIKIVCMKYTILISYRCHSYLQQSCGGIIHL